MARMICHQQGGPHVFQVTCAVRAESMIKSQRTADKKVNDDAYTVGKKIVLN